MLELKFLSARIGIQSCRTASQPLGAALCDGNTENYSMRHAHACLRCSNPGSSIKECLAAVSDWCLPNL